MKKQVCEYSGDDKQIFVTFDLTSTVLKLINVRTPKQVQNMLKGGNVTNVYVHVH